MRFSFFRIIVNLMLITVLHAITGAAELDNLRPMPVILEKSGVPLSESTLNYLNNLRKDKVKIWIFFNDKGVFDEADFQSASGRIEIDEHSGKRRAKVGIDGVVFADLPVKQDYIDRIVDLGAGFRRASRWLNAASFEVRLELVDRIAALPFVNRIQPVASYESVRPVEVETDIESPKFDPAEQDALDYGASWIQNFMINMHQMHLMGYNGQGVIVAMLDTGYRRTHNAFAIADSTGRVLAEYDFIFDDNDTQNEPEDNPAQHNHGTYCWSTLGGYVPGYVIGPAYGASFLLAKTEDIRSETPVEEDNWVAGLEWADSLEADVVSTSLSYSDWYSYSDFDGNTAVTTVAANTAAGLGIVVCNSIGNSGPASGTLGAPSDAFDILACGAVHSYEVIADFSSNGPTFDGRTKPEVCAMGVNTRCAGADSDIQYTYKNGTSLSTPLVGGAVAVLLSANPTLNPWQVRKALMETADHATAPDNSYGWGIIDALMAFNWGANFTADTTIGQEYLTVNFADSSTPPATSWKWHFGDVDSSTTQNPTHYYGSPGSYDVTLTIESSEGTLSRVKEEFITVTADTLALVTTHAPAGDTAVMLVNLTNSQEINKIVIPVSYTSTMSILLTEATRGNRTVAFESIAEIHRNDMAKELVIELIADDGGGSPLLQPGSGEIARLRFLVGPSEPIGSTASVNIFAVGGYEPELSNAKIAYAPEVTPGEVIVETGLRGDADNSGAHNLLDVNFLINYLYKGGPAPISLRAGDANSSGSINLLDATYLITYLYKDGPPPEQ